MTRNHLIFGVKTARGSGALKLINASDSSITILCPCKISFKREGDTAPGKEIDVPSGERQEKTHQMGYESIQNIKAREHLIYTGKINMCERPVRKTKQKTGPRKKARGKGD